MPAGHAAVPPTLTAIVSPRVQAATLVCACAGASALVFALDPRRHGIYPPCLFHRATGLYCAGCGATRALYALLHGRPIESLHDNLLFTTLLPVALAWAGVQLWRTWRCNAWPRYSIGPGPLLRFASGLGVVMLIFMIARNLPGWPFALLRPLG